MSGARRFVVTAVLLVVTQVVVDWPTVREHEWRAAPAPTTRTIAGWRALAAELPATAAPVILTYPDVRPAGTAADAVSPQQLDAQLTGLEIAGYRTLGAASRAGGAGPARSVRLIFTGRTTGLWDYADRVLARHHARAAVTPAAAASLSMAEVRRLAAGGRWDFPATTDDGENRVEVRPGTTAKQLVKQVAARTPAGPDRAVPAMATRWGDRTGRMTDGYARVTGVVPPRVGEQIAYYAPAASAGWADYRAAATVTGLDRSADTATMLVRAAGSRAAGLRLSGRTARMVDMATGTTLAAAVLPAARAAHRIEVTVTATGTTAVIDGAVTLAVPAAVGDTGGVALAVHHGAGQGTVVFGDVTVAALDQPM